VTAASELPHGRSRYTHAGCRCGVCREAMRVYVAGRRAAKRGLAPVPVANATEAVADVRQDVATAQNCAVGPCVAAVREVLAELPLPPGYEVEAAAAEAMARILDDHRLATTAPSACRQLAQVMDRLRKAAEPRRGRLAAISKMSSRPDAG
jgi:bacterioferritin-associated ferredoxin